MACDVRKTPQIPGKNFRVHLFGARNRMAFESTMSVIAVSINTPYATLGTRP